MFGIGETELVIIIIFCFMLFGPDKLPGMGRTIGRALRQFRTAQEDFTQVVQAEVVDPMTSAINEPGKKKRASGPAAVDDDADLEGSDEVSRASRGETFAERKARLKAEREAREAQERAEAEAAERAAAAEAEAVGTDADGSINSSGATGASGAPVADSAVEERVSGESTEPEPERPTSAAALYAMTPRRTARKQGTSDAPVEAQIENEAEKPGSQDAASARPDAEVPAAEDVTDAVPDFTADVPDAVPDSTISVTESATGVDPDSKTAASAGDATGAAETVPADEGATTPREDPEAGPTQQEEPLAASLDPEGKEDGEEA